jgi:ubiquinone/menaquinone biosynthesis C-methylase UbiE
MPTPYMTRLLRRDAADATHQTTRPSEDSTLITRQPDWKSDELAHAGDEHLDPDYVAAYDRKAGVDPTGDVALLLGMGLNEDSTVVDIGAGTGTFALAIAPHCRRVVAVAVDVSPSMLTVMREKAQQSSVTNVEVAHGGFLSYRHAGDPAGAVYTRNALHHLPDFWKVVALESVAAMLRPGGVLRLHDLVFHCQPQEVESVVEDWLASAAPSPDLGWTREELETHLRTEYSTFTWLLEPMLERAGFDIVDASYRPNRPYVAYTCVRRGIVSRSA